MTNLTNPPTSQPDALLCVARRWEITPEMLEYPAVLPSDEFNRVVYNWSDHRQTTLSDLYREERMNVSVFMDPVHVFWDVVHTVWRFRHLNVAASHKNFFLIKLRNVIVGSDRKPLVHVPGGTSCFSRRPRVTLSHAIYLPFPQGQYQIAHWMAQAFGYIGWIGLIQDDLEQRRKEGNMSDSSFPSDPTDPINTFTVIMEQPMFFKKGLGPVQGSEYQGNSLFSYMYDSLRLAGIPHSRLVMVPQIEQEQQELTKRQLEQEGRHLQLPPDVFVENLYLGPRPCFAQSFMSHVCDRALQMMRKGAKVGSTASLPIDQGDILFLSRGDPAKQLSLKSHGAQRHISNIPELLQRVRELFNPDWAAKHIRVVTVSDMPSLDDRVEPFQNAKYVIGEWGANWVNAAFMPSGTRVLILGDPYLGHGARNAVLNTFWDFWMETAANITGRFFDVASMPHPRAGALPGSCLKLKENCGHIHGCAWQVDELCLVKQVVDDFRAYGWSELIVTLPEFESRNATQ
jgi:hypothetical protein